MDVTTESNIYQVKLKDALVSSLVFKRGKDAELAWIDGQINLHDDEAHEKDTHKVKIEDAIEESVPTLVPLPTSDVSVLVQHVFALIWNRVSFALNIYLHSFHHIHQSL